MRNYLKFENSKTFYNEKRTKYKFRIKSECQTSFNEYDLGFRSHLMFSSPIHVLMAQISCMVPGLLGEYISAIFRAF